MKKKIILPSVLTSLAILATMFVLTACGRQNAGTETPQAEQNGSDRGNMRRPDFGQPEKPADIRGVVKSMTGNMVTVLKIDLPSRGQNASSATENASTTQKNGEDKIAAPVISVGGTGAPAGMARAAGGQGGMYGGPGGEQREAGTTDRATRLAALKALSTGEETVVIPVGIKMMKSSANTKTREMVEASLTDITADKMITIWFNAAVTDKKVAEFVLIN